MAPLSSLRSTAVSRRTLIASCVLGVLLVGAVAWLPLADSFGDAPPVEAASVSPETAVRDATMSVVAQMGNPIVNIEGQQAINLTSLSSGNNNNCSSACVAVPSVTTVFYTMMPPSLQPAVAQMPSMAETVALEVKNITIKKRQRSIFLKRIKLTSNIKHLFCVFCIFRRKLLD